LKENIGPQAATLMIAAAQSETYVTGVNSLGFVNLPALHCTPSSSNPNDLPQVMSPTKEPALQVKLDEAPT
jgi:hypothetical protein